MNDLYASQRVILKQTAANGKYVAAEEFYNGSIGRRILSPLVEMGLLKKSPPKIMPDGGAALILRLTKRGRAVVAVSRI